jgi:hypothetical protein
MQRCQPDVDVAAIAQVYCARVAVHGALPCFSRAICFAC